MNEQQALSLMKPPAAERSDARGAFNGGVMQIWLNRLCDKACFGCTQGSNLGGNSGFMTPDQFERACQSLEGWTKTVGLFGGNPALNKHFGEICEIMRKYIPFKQRGLWCNNPVGKGKVMRETFNPVCSNLNVHLDRKAYEEFRRDWPESRPFGLTEDSRHSPPMVAMLDMDSLPNADRTAVVENTEENRWDLIARCDVNQKWSPMICVVGGELVGYFCEEAAAQAIMHAEDPDWPKLGTPIEPGWWKRPMQDFADQVRWHCHRCGIPLRGHGELACASNGVEQTSKTHANIYKPKSPGREVQVVNQLVQLDVGLINDMTRYVQNANR